MPMFFKVFANFFSKTFGGYNYYLYLCTRNRKTGCSAVRQRAWFGTRCRRFESCRTDKSSRRKTKQFSSYFRFSTSHTTVRAVPHTAVSILDTIRDTHPLKQHTLPYIDAHLLLSDTNIGEKIPRISYPRRFPKSPGKIITIQSHYYLTITQKTNKPKSIYQDFGLFVFYNTACMGCLLCSNGNIR